MKYTKSELDGQRWPVKKFIKEYENLPVDEILLEPKLNVGEGGHLVPITIDELKDSDYLGDKGEFYIYEDDDGMSDKGPIILRYLWFLIPMHPTKGDR